MPAWDVPGPNNENGFNPAYDPSMAFANTPTSSNFDFPLQNAPMQQQQQQRMPNGSMRNGSPAFQNPMYQTTSVVPSKRPHDDYTASPRQASRSQTPQQAPYPGFPGTTNGQQTHTPYQHLQQPNSSNTSPSPIMQNQHFNPQAIPQRMQTASPSPFSPAAQSFGLQGSPPQSDYGSRVETPSNAGQSYFSGHQYSNGPGVNPQGFTPPPGSIGAGMAGGGSSYHPNNVSLENQRRAFESKQQSMVRQLQANNVAAQQRHLMGASNPMVNPSGQMAAHQYQQQQQQQQQQAARLLQTQRAVMQPGNPAEFLKNVAQYMQQRQQPFNPSPQISGRPFNGAMIYSIVMKQGGSKKVTMSNAWGAVAASVGLHPAQFPTAGHEIQAYWHQNFMPYELMAIQTMQRERNRQLGAQPGLPQHLQTDGVPMQDQFSAQRQLNPQSVDHGMMHMRRQSGTDFQTPVKSGSIPQHPQLNGFSPSHETRAAKQQTMLPQVTLGAQSGPFVTPTSAPTKQNSYQEVIPLGPSHDEALTNRTEPVLFPLGPLAKTISDTFTPAIRSGQAPTEPKTPKNDTTAHHGGIQVDGKTLPDEVNSILLWRPEFISEKDLGTADIRAMIMSLKSGINGEVKLALDMLTILSMHHFDRIPLECCEDLVETLIDCAEDQLDLLAENTIEVSDAMLIPPYEELVRSCNSEIKLLQDVPEFASPEYYLDRAVDRLLCISRLLRNLSWTGDERSLMILADSGVIKFISTVIRYLGTRNMLLRTNRNSLEFTKDIVVYLRNVAHRLELASKEEALCILQFLLSFAPLPLPVTSESKEIMFSSYQPTLHRYLPSAVSSLAKLLAVGEPNRAFLKSIFSADIASSPSSDLLTRAFGLVIAPLPSFRADLLSIVETRMPFLCQGLIAAESLVSLLPQNEHRLARSWLTSQDGFAHSLLRLIALVSIEAPLHQQRQHPKVPSDTGSELLIQNGLGILRKLGEKSKDAEALAGPGRIVDLPKKGILLDALRAGRLPPRLVQQLRSYPGLDN